MEIKLAPIEIQHVFANTGSAEINVILKYCDPVQMRQVDCTFSVRLRQPPLKKFSAFLRYKETRSANVIAARVALFDELLIQIDHIGDYDGVITEDRKSAFPALWKNQIIFTLFESSSNYDKILNPQCLRSRQKNINHGLQGGK